MNPFTGLAPGVIPTEADLSAALVTAGASDAGESAQLLLTWAVEAPAPNGWKPHLRTWVSIIATALQKQYVYIK